MKYLSIQTFQCGISVSGAATFTGGATINLLALNGATTSSEASLFLGAHGTLEGGQLVLQKGTSQTYAAHLDNYSDQFRVMYGTNTGSTGIALGVNLATGQLNLPFYTTTTSFSGTVVGYLAFDSTGKVITTPIPAGGVTSIIAGTGITVSSGTGNVTVSIGQSVATSATPSFDQVYLTNNGNGTNVKIGDDAWIGDINTSNTFRVMGQQNNANGYIVFGNANTDALGRSGTGNLTYAGSTVWTASTLTNLNQLTNGPGYITAAALAGYVPTSRLITINGVSYDLSADRSWTIATASYTSKLQHQVKAGVAINKGQAVYVTSADGTNMIVGLASNVSEATSSKTMGLLDATVSTNGFANVVTEGLLAGLDTSTAGAAGDPVWLGTGGNLIYGLLNKPYAPAHLVFIGIVTRKNNSNGEIFVKVQNGFELKEIHDVDLFTTTPVNGHILGFDGTLWVNKTVAGWLGYTPANASGTTNYISKFTGSTTLGNSQIFDNGTNVGIGTTSPNRTLSVNGIVGISSATANTQQLVFSVDSGASYITSSYFGSSSYVPMYLETGGNVRLAILTNGNVGIGTTSPAYKLDVATGNDNAIRILNSSGSNNNGLALSVGSGTPWLDFYGGRFDIKYNTSPGSWNSGANTFLSILSSGNVGIGTTSPSQLLHVAGNIRVTGAFYDSNNQAGTSGQILKSTGSGTDWVSLSEITGVDGSGTANYVTKWSDADTITNSLIYDNGTNVGIGTTSPGYNFDVNGQVRVQDKLRVGTVNSGNGVVHMSSSATINPSATTIVWAQNVSVGMCAFIEYYILNNNSLTDQRAGTIMVTWNQSGTPTIAHTETTTPDIGSTIAVNFTSSLVGSDARINAVNSSANPYTIVMSYKYF